LPSGETAPPLDPIQEQPAPVIMLDCRWLGWGGAGRVTEMLLAELRDARVPGHWRLWGEPERLKPFLFAGASIVPWHGNAPRRFGQADLFRVPRSDLAVYLHQIRPFRPGRSITFVHDTIPLRFERRRVGRIARRFFYWLACRMSSRIVTISAWSRESIVRDLGVSPAKVTVVNLAVDQRRVDRIRAMRQSSNERRDVVFVGRFGHHKNLHRLCRAFQATDAHRQGDRLVLVGGIPAEVEALSAWLDAHGLSGVEVRGLLPESELDDLLATCKALVQSSLEEGFGLPAVEAAAVGVQVAASRTGFAPEIPAELVTFLDPLDERSIAMAIDSASSRPDADLVWLPRSTLAAGVLGAVRQISRRIESAGEP
jgi:glycosyltransferase involved in cell wall biosynthesis